jgi:hypothetical protein
MLKPQDFQLEPAELKKIAKKHMKERVKAIRAGRVIRRRYATSTAVKRRRYGLRTDRVNLTGNRRYSGKSWRLLDSWRVRVDSSKRVSIVWTRNEATVIYDAQVRRYGRFLKLY